ncbi:MAG: BrnT family toxin [Acidobacteria bacterium]|nr:BrnT family toxin [Acidobacteriota bacterium]
MEMRFAWDTEKAESNRRKQGVAFEEALTVFADPLARIHQEQHHSPGESREIIVGHSMRGRLLLVCFTERRTGVRLISARRVTRRERKDFEKHQST